jgi:TolA-binding protein
MLQALKVFLLIALLSSGVIYAMGGPPPAPPSPEKDTGMIKYPEVEPTAEKQFERAYSEYVDALRVSSYYAEKAVKSFKNYLKYYPQDIKRIDALFLLSKACFLNNDYAGQEEYLNQYLQESPTSNSYQKYAELDSGTILVRKGDNSGAKLIFDKLLDNYGNDPEMKRNIYKQSLPVYENENNKERLTTIYSYYTANRHYLENQNLYYVYCYKLGVIYYEKGDIQKAKYYFKIVAEEKSPQNKFLAESARSYLSKIK